MEDAGAMEARAVVAMAAVTFLRRNCGGVASFYGVRCGGSCALHRRTRGGARCRDGGGADSGEVLQVRGCVLTVAFCARRWRCGGETVRKMVAQGADSWWWRERWRRRCCANGGRWWRCHGEARWWSENKLPWWLTEMVAAAAVEGGHGG
ncbi:hypothetical protein DEO72_LG5g1569 [Vigna unguiculata]|uniref:Uncharacterized protein n=1 Tax=Vigna unguiculata TaxID=3917 RepID=A0A4D6M080_VIGUN|nr:hypothetical protein DEO72_LG5g1569 [Vigna unguiculata]